eukprot:m.53915 g.53915  ORF g.53915 m.53915 type:complete len:83 (-) comp18451_c0_seq1:49-297(-)
MVPLGSDTRHYCSSQTSATVKDILLLATVLTWWTCIEYLLGPDIRESRSTTKLRSSRARGNNNKNITTNEGDNNDDDNKQQQ